MASRNRPTGWQKLRAAGQFDYQGARTPAGILGPRERSYRDDLDALERVAGLGDELARYRSLAVLIGQQADDND